jgi:hypothetical protein
MGFDSVDNKNILRIRPMPITIQGRYPQLKYRTPALYIYSDIIEDVLVGDVERPLLRAVGIDGIMGQTTSKEFLHLHYKPVKKGYINSILIEIKDDTGRDIDFTSGKTICTLHFRRCGLEV